MISDLHLFFLTTTFVLRIMDNFNYKKIPGPLKNGETITFLFLVQKEAESSTDECVVSLLTNLKSKLSELDSAAKMVNTVSRTQNLVSSFKELKQKFGVLKKVIENFALLSDELGTTAKKLDVLIVNAGRFKSKSYFDTIAKISTAITSIDESVTAKELEAMGVANLLKELKQKIEIFRETYAERNSYREQRKKLLADSRKAAEEAYNVLMMYVATKATLGDEICQGIVKRVNEALYWNVNKNTSNNQADKQPKEAVIES